MSIQKKIQRIDDDDLLRSLPDELISYILSFLPTRYAFQTCILSKNWENRWTTIHKININDDESKLKKDKKPSFISFMERRVSLLQKSRITNLYLKINRKYNSCHLTSWVYGFLTHSFASLTVLELLINGTLKELPFEKCFPQLKRLCIGGGAVEHCGRGLLDIQNSQSSLLLDFPVLVVLEFKGCRWLNLKYLEIRAPKLIVFRSYCRAYGFGSNNYEIKMDAARLDRFEVSGISHISMDIYALSTPSVQCAALTHGIDSETIGFRANIILERFRGLKRLTLSRQVVRALIRVKPTVALPTFDQLKELKLHSSCDSNHLLELLKMGPCLESLILSLESWIEYDYEQVEVLPVCLVSHLKAVTLTDYQGDSGHIDFAKFILKQAKKLLTFRVHLDTKMRKYEKTHVKLLVSELPKASEYARIVVI